MRRYMINNIPASEIDLVEVHVPSIETTRLLFYSIQFTCTVFCTSVAIFLCYLCPDEGLFKTKMRRFPINYVPLTVDYCWFCFLLTLLALT